MKFLFLLKKIKRTIRVILNKINHPYRYIAPCNTLYLLTGSVLYYVKKLTYDALLFKLLTMPVLLQLFQYLGGGVANVIQQLDSDLDDIERYIGLFDTTVRTNMAGLKNAIQIGPQDNRTRVLRGWRSRFADLKKLKASKKITVTISHSPWLHMLNILTGGNDRKILVLHGPVVYRSKFFDPLIFKLFFILFDKRTDTYITVSEELKLQLLNHVKDETKIFCIINHINKADVLQKADLGIWPGVRDFLTKNSIFVSAGRLHAQKNFKFLITLFWRLKQTEPYKNQKLVIVGEGTQLAYLLKLAKKLDLKTAVIEDIETDVVADPDILFTGFLNNPFPVIKQSCAYISTSLYEGYPFAVCEAMILNKLLIVSDCPTGHLEIITGSIQTDHKPGRNRFGILLPIREMDETTALDHWEKFMMQNSTYILDHHKQDITPNPAITSQTGTGQDAWRKIIFANN